MRIRFERSLALAALLGASTVLPASAQYIYPPRVVAPVPAPVPHYGPIPPHEIVRIMMRRGFLEIDPPQMRGDIYLISGISRNGDRVRLVVDAYDGEILRRTRFESGGFAGGPYYEAPVTAYPRPPRGLPRGEGTVRVIEPDDEPFEESFDERRVQRDIPPPPPARERAPRRTSKLEQPDASGQSATTAKTPPRQGAARVSPTPGSAAPAVPPANAARPATASEAPTKSAAAPEIRIPAPPPVPAPEIAAAPEATGSARPVRVIEGVTPAPVEVPKPAE